MRLVATILDSTRLESLRAQVALGLLDKCDDADLEKTAISLRAVVQNLRV